MLCSAENSPCRVGTRQSRSVMDQSLGWRRSCSHESHTPRRAYTSKDLPIRRHKPNFLGTLALSCKSRAAQHSRCFALQWLACVRMATSAQLLHQTNWLPASSAGYDAGSSCFPGHRLCTPQARARIDGLGATGGTARRHRPSGQIGLLVQTLWTCGIRPCLPATIPVFQLFDAPRADGTHPLTRSFASPKELIDESDVLSPLWGVFPLTAARGLPQELHSLLGLCLRVAKAKSGMLREPCGALWGVVLLGPQLGQLGRPTVADDGVFYLPSRCAGAQKTSTSPTYHSVSKGRHPSNRWLCESPSPSVVLG